jgi:hypothetical protein
MAEESRQNHRACRVFVYQVASKSSMKTERELHIDAYIEQHPTAELKPESVIIHGKLESVPAYRLPARLLVFNIGNGRFRAELLAAEKRLNRKLDATKENDIKEIQRLLLEQDEKETEILKADLKKHGQIIAGIITHDGAVINANRRMAILQALHEETAEERFAYLKVARLPKGVDAKDLWRIEANLQFGRDFRLDYGQVNELLKIREGRNNGLTDKQISEALAGRYSEKKVAEKLEILKLMDSYLHSIGKPGEYTHIQEERAGEKFNSLHDQVVSSLKKGSHKLEIPKITQVAFALIEGKEHSHWKIRRLREVAQSPKARTALYEAFDSKGKLKADRAAVKDAFDTADFIIEMELEKDKPEKLAGKALSALNQIELKHPSVKNAEFQKLLSDIRSEVDRLTVLAKKHGKAGN